MHVISVRNVCEALPKGIDLLLEEGMRSPSRAGEVLVAPWPVATVYSHPRERVLFSPIRDANPAFFMAETLWMLAGRNDAAFLDLFVKDFGSRFAEKYGTIHGAYGERWRRGFGFDQIKEIIRRLIENPNDRQCVLQMWDGSDKKHLRDAGIWSYQDLTGDWRDRPCNTHAYFRVRDGLLDFGVCCLSNDILMGAYGANAVHFSILQEYMAAMVDMGVGTYTQFSFNYHVYVKDLELLRKRLGQSLTGTALLRNDYLLGVKPLPLVSDPESFDEDVVKLLAAVESFALGGCVWPELRNEFLRETAYPLLFGYLARSTELAEQVAAPDWSMALIEWLQRRGYGKSEVGE